MLGEKKMWQENWRKKRHWKLKAETMATWSTWRKCTGFPPVTPGGASIHLRSAGKGYRKQFSPLICHMWDCIWDCIHTCALDYSSTWKVLSDGFESCRRHHAGQAAGPQGVWRGWEACSGCREGFGLSSEVCSDMMRNNSQKLERRICSLDVRNISSL